MLKLLLCLGLAAATFGQISPPAEGLYVTIRNDLLNELGNDLSLDIADFANTDTTFPEQDGHSGGASYQFTNFLFDIDLQGLTFVSAAAPALTLTWTKFYFLVQWNYHVCDILCEDGTVDVFTLNANVQLQAVLNLDLAGPKVALTCSAVNLIFGDNDIEVTADDGNVASAVANNFQTYFQQGLVTAINKAAAKYVDSMATSRPFPQLGLNLIFTGGFDLYPASAPNLILYVAGEFTGTNQQAPPFTPDFVPPASAFTTPASPVDMLVTPYMLRSAIWGLSQDGKFNIVITPEDVPANSPVKLNTDSPTWKAVAPGLANYPNMNITISIYLFNTSDVSITTDGVYAWTTVNATFNLVNATLKAPAFTALIDVGFTVGVSASLSGNDLVLTPKLANFKAVVDVTGSSVGPVSNTVLQTILSLVFSFAPSPKPETFAGPADFTLSNLAYTPQAGYADLGLTMAWNKPVPGTQCAPGGLTCPTANTCCQWSNVWDCCTAPNAVCCTAGCCPSGSTCVNGGCE